MKKILLCLLAFSLNSVAVYSQTGTTPVAATDTSGWVKLGDKNVDFALEQDEIKPSGTSDRFSALRFRVTRESIKLVDIQVHYDGDLKESVKINKPIQPSGHGQLIQLQNEQGREIKKIVFTYRTLPNNAEKKAIVEVWGLKASRGK